LVSDRSAAAVIVSVSVALLFAGLGSGVVLETVAVLTSVPAALMSIVQVAVYVTELPAGRLRAASLMLPEPAAVLPVAPPAATLV
jgi:hypothetical protein